MTNLTVVIDHVGGLRRNMATSTPDPLSAAVLAQLAGADGIGVCMQEDSRFISEGDVRLLRQAVHSRLVLYIPATSQMVGFALETKPERVVLIPEKATNDPTVFGLDLAVDHHNMIETIDTLQTNGISVGVCIPADPEQAKLAHQARANWVQLHAGALRAAQSAATQAQELERIIDTIKMAYKLRMRIAVGNGLDYRLIKLFKGLGEIDEFSLGQSIIARAVLTGIEAAVREMLQSIRELE